MPSIAAPFIAIALGAELAASAAAPASPAKYSLTVSGGVSLGAYQAGFLYYVLAANQVNSGRAAELKIATGASAGSVNSLMSLRYACGGLPLDPRQSLFARVWLPLGFRELYRPREVQALGAFSRSAFEEGAALIEEELRGGLPAGCDVVLGVAVTRVKPRELKLAGGRTTIPRTVEKFVLRIQGRGPGKMPRFTNYLDLDSQAEQPALPEGPDGTLAFEDVRDLLLASGAFPVAFPPQPVHLCMAVTRGKSPPFCRPSEATAVPFIDGGVFDNDPLRLAAQVASGGLEAGPRGLRFRELGLREGGRPPPEVEFAFVSADARTYPEGRGRPAAARSDSLVSLLGDELGAFVSTARTKELDLLLTEYPHVSEALIYPQRHYPAASEPMFAFFGFFERSLRDFDFTLGMYEARRHLARFSIPRLQKTERRGDWVLPEATGEARAAPDAWRPLACMRAVVDSEGDAATLCAGADLAQFRVLLQASLDRLWNDCQVPAARDLQAPTFQSCEPVRAGAAEPRVPGLPPSPGYELPSESRTAYVVRVLAAYGFDWRDMGYGHCDATAAMVGLRRDLGALGDSLSGAQPDLAARASVGAVADVATDLFYYLPPSNAVWVLLGRGLELGGAVSVLDVDWCRVGGALKLQNLYQALSSGSRSISFLPVAGFQVVPAALGSTFFQASFLLRGGYLFSLDGPSCGGENGKEIGACSRPEAEAGAALSIARILRIQLVAEWYPPIGGAPGLWALVPAMGFQMSF